MTEAEGTFTVNITTPPGNLLITANAAALTNIRFTEEPLRSSQSSSALLHETERQLKAWFSGKLICFDLPLQPEGTAFQKQVWEELMRIPYGQTISYHELALRLDNVKAIRAVGAANSRNPLAIVIPCHRVIGANGHLTGYAGGISRKRWLLQHEATFAHHPMQLF